MNTGWEGEEPGDEKECEVAEEPLVRAGVRVAGELNVRVGMATIRRGRLYDGGVGGSCLIERQTSPSNARIVDALVADAGVVDVEEDARAVDVRFVNRKEGVQVIGEDMRVVEEEEDVRVIEEEEDPRVVEDEK